MTPNRLAPLIAPALLLCLGLPLAATTQDEVLSAQVLNGWRMPSGHQMAAVKLDLAPGWKTYWRSPGEAGIPPQFDWSGSENLKAVILHWPSPEVFESSGMTTLGYHHQLVLPVELVAKDPAQPVKLRAEIALGICRDICLPASVSLTAVLGAQSGGATTKGAKHDPLITAALQARPLTAKEAGLGRISCQVEPIKDGLRLTANMILPQRGADAETVAFETADPSVWVAEAQTQRSGDALVSTTDLVAPSGLPFALDRSTLRLTVISGKSAVEIQGCPGG